MPPTTLLQLLSLLSLPLRERAGDLFGQHVLARFPRQARAALVALERCGMRGVGWGIVALDVELRRSNPPRHSYIGPLLTLVCALMLGCAPSSHDVAPAELDAPADLEGLEELDAPADLEGLEELDRQNETPILSVDAPAELDAPAAVFTLDYRHCRGAWADRDDSSTRYTPHPETGLCTFACTWQDARCGESWYGDPRCFPAHGARLESLCAELGGTCRKALTSDVTYCEAPL